MESLSKPEKGWQQKSNLVTGKVGKSGGKFSGKRRLKGQKDASSLPALPSEPPKTPMAFERDWRRHCGSEEAKLWYLHFCGPAGLRQIFKTEMDVALLGQVVKALADATQADAAGARLAAIVFNTITALPDTGRFRLNVQFMDAVDRSNADVCFTWLRAAAAVPGVSGALLPFTVESVDAARAKFAR